MKKYFICSIVAILLSFQAFSQSTDTPTAESLERKLVELKNEDLVDALNLIAYTKSISHDSAFDQNGDSRYGFIHRADSIFHYASRAYDEAKKINYKKGMVDALNELAHSEYLRVFNLGLANRNDSANTHVNAQQKYSSQAISIAKEITYNDGLGRAYMEWHGDSKNDTTDYLRLAIDYFHKAGDEPFEGEASTWVGEGYLWKGSYEKAIVYCDMSLMLNHRSLHKARTEEEQEWRNWLYQESLSNMATLFKEAGDYESSLGFLTRASDFASANKLDWDMSGEKAEIFRYLGNADSSFYYLRDTRGSSGIAWTNKDLGETYLMINQYDSALDLFNKSLTEFRKINVKGNLIEILTDIAKTYMGKGKYNTALPYSQEALSYAILLKKKQGIMQGDKVLSEIYFHLGRTDSAYLYLNNYIQLKDSILNQQFLFRINNYKRALDEEKKQAQIMLLDKDNKLNAVQLKQEASQKNLLLILLSALAVTGIFIYSNIQLKRKNERQQLQNELKAQELENEKKLSELEMQALRAQMNPHFIFNCLSSINRFILKNEGKTASSYLTRFSRLMRMVLMHSQKPVIALEDEIEMLRLYLEMERLRFKNAFDYGITFMNEIDSGNVFIPPLLLQPFCENAIWHGLMHKNGPGRLDIELGMNENILHCIITDNGVGREKAAEMKSKTAEKEKSMGLKITTERLALFNREKGVHTFYEIEDIKDEYGNAAGTKVVIKISFKEPVKETI
jgi:sensor histidine kinase YesM